MKLVTFDRDGRRCVGRIDPDRALVRDLSPRLAPGDGLAEVVARWPDLHGALSADPHALPGWALADVRLCAPFPEPRRNLFCVGRNYAEHADEMRRARLDTGTGPARPIVFTKAPSTVVGPGATVDLHPALTAQVDYEAELAVIIGRGGRGIPAERAMDHVWGYTIVNDVTARDLQAAHQQWFLGKSLDTHCPMGPWAVTADEIALDQVEVRSRVNGQPRQYGRIADLIADVPTLIATISAGMTLQPGDILATGTPSGVGMGFDPPRFLRPGDVVEITVTGLGTLRNEFR